MKTLTGIIALMLTLLFGVSNVAVAADKATTPAAPAAERRKGTAAILEDIQHRQMVTGKVTQVNEKAKTFTVMAKGKPFTFGSKSLKVTPKVEEIIDITYTQNPGGPMEATTINTSKSNTY